MKILDTTIYGMYIFLSIINDSNNIVRIKIDKSTLDVIDKQSIGVLKHCKVKFTNGEVYDNLIIAICEDAKVLSSIDNKIFFYCKDIFDYEYLFKENNGEDFVILSENRNEND